MDIEGPQGASLLEQPKESVALPNQFGEFLGGHTQYVSQMVRIARWMIRWKPPFWRDLTWRA